MFSSLSKYARSPKQLLASYLSRSLAEFFDVDPNGVETNLLTNAKVALHNVNVKEQVVGRLLVHGSVDKIEFAWAWGSTQNLITNVTLTIEGVHIHVEVCSEEQQLKHQIMKKEESLTATSSESKAPPEQNTGAPPDWKTSYIHQIIDCLTLIVKDATISIHVDANSQIHVQGKNMELHTTHQQTGSLTQRLKMESLEAWITETGNTEGRWPILDPFGYHATVQRVAGRRFLDGVLSGLLIQGDDSVIDGAPSIIRVHAGTKQIAGLTRLQEVLLSLTDENVTANDEAEGIGGASNPELAQPDVTASSTDNIGSSVFSLPVRSMEVVLENQTTLRLAGCTIQYCTDGTQLSVDCTQGIWMDDLALSQNNRWVLDLVTCELLLDSLKKENDVFFDAKSCGSSAMTSASTGASNTDDDDKDAPDFRLDLTLEMFENIFSGIQAIMPQCNHALELAESMVESQPPATATSPPWTVRANGIVAFRFTGRDPSSWLELSAKFPKIVQSTESVPFIFDCESIWVASDSGGTSLVRIPGVRTADGRLQVQDTVDITISSMESLAALQQMANQVTEVIGDTSSADAAELPLDLWIPAVNISMDGPDPMSVKTRGLEGSRSTWKISQVEANGFNGSIVRADGLQATLDGDNISFLVQTVQKLTIQGVECLAAPLQGTRIAIKDNEVDLQFKALNIISLEDLMKSKSETPGDDSRPDTRFQIPRKVTARLESLALTLDDGKSAQLQGVECVVHANDETQSPVVGLRLQSIHADLRVGVKASCTQIQAQAHFSAVSNSDQSSESSLLVIDGLGSLSSANLRIGEVSKLSMAKLGHLSKPTTDVRVALSGSMATVHAKSIHLQGSKSIGGDEQSAATESEELPFRLPLDLTSTVDDLHIAFDNDSWATLQGFRFTAKRTSEDTSSMPMQIQIHNLKLQKEPGTKLSCARINAQAQLLCGGGTNELSYPVAVPGLGAVNSATVNCGEISELAIASIGHLAKPTADVTAELNGSNASVNFSSVLVQYADLFKAGGTATGQNQPMKVNWPQPLSVNLGLKRLVVMPEFGLGKPGVCFDGVRVAFESKETPDSAKLSASCNYFQVRGPDQSMGTAKTLIIEAVLRSTEAGGMEVQRAAASIAEMAALKISGIVELAKPMNQLEISFENDLVAVTCGEIDVVQLAAAIAQGGASTDPEQPHPPQLPFSVRLKAGRFSARALGGSPEQPGQTVLIVGDQMQLDSFSVSNDPGSLSVQLASRALHVSSPDTFCIATTGVRLSAKFRHADESCVSVPLVGDLVFASTEIDEISEMSYTDVISLTEPMLKLKAAFQESTLSCTLDHLNLATTIVSTSNAPADSSPESLLPAALFRIKHSFTVKSLSLDILTESAPKQHVSIQSARVDLRPTAAKDQNTLLLCCDAVTIENAVGFSFGSKGLSLQFWSSLELNRADANQFIRFPADLRLDKATLSLKSITNLTIPGVGMLLGQLEGTNMAYGKDGATIDISDDLEWVMIDFDEPVVEGTIGYDTTEIPVAVASPVQSQHAGLELLSFPIQLTMKTMKIENHRDSMVFGCKTVEARLTPDPFEASTHTMTVNCGLAKFESQAIANAAAKGLAMNAVLLTASVGGSTFVENPPFQVPGICSIASGSLHVEEITTLCIPGVAKLVEPLKSTSVQYNGSQVAVGCKSVVAQRDVSRSRPSDSGSQPGRNASLPCILSISMEDVVFKDTLSSGQVCGQSSCDTLTCSLEPALAQVGAAYQGPGAALYIQGNGVENSTSYYKAQIPEVSASGLVQFECSDTIGNLVVGCNSVELEADFSKWRTSQSDPESPTPWFLPFAMVKSFELNLRCTGPLVKVSNAKLSCEAFRGDSRTSLETIQSHYSGIVQGRIPYLITKANIAGANVGDSISMVASRVATSSSVIGATAGIAARDAIGGTISMGKSSRGVSSTEKYKFGDVSRGVVASVKAAAAKGSSLRGSDSYAVGDFTSGAACATGEYVTRNSARLVGAGGSAAGMVVGAAIAGPIGLIAGSFVGGSAAKLVKSDDSDDDKKLAAEPRHSDANRRRSSNGMGNPHPLGGQGQTSELLIPIGESTRVPGAMGGVDLATNAEATWIGDVATASRPAVMVQARVVDPSNPHGARALSQQSNYSYDPRVYSPPAHNGTTHNVSGPSGYARDTYPQAPRQNVAMQAAYNQPPTMHQQGQSSSRRVAPNTNAHQGQGRPNQNQASDGEGYRFGDVTRGIIARGRQLDGREANSGYKFGDFTRGLFR